MIRKTSGILLQLTPYRDSSAICKVFCQELGLISVIANGVRSSRRKSSSKGAILQPLNLLDLVIYHHPDRDIHRISDAQLKYLYLNISSNYYKSLIATFLLEFMYQVLRKVEATDPLYEFIETSMIWLDSKPFHPDFHIWFMTRFTDFLGIQPYNNFSKDHNPAFSMEEGMFINMWKDETQDVDLPFSQYISELLSMDLSELGEWKLNRAERKQLLKIWIAYYQRHIDGFDQLKSLAVLEQMS